MVYDTLTYRGECAAKEQQLREFFDRARIKVGEFVEGDSSFSRGWNAASPLNYRNKVVYHFGRAKAAKGDATFLSRE